MFRTFSSSSTGPAGAAGAAATGAGAAGAATGSSFLPQAASKTAVMASARTCFFMARKTPKKRGDRRIGRNTGASASPSDKQQTGPSAPHGGEAGPMYQKKPLNRAQHSPKRVNALQHGPSTLHPAPFSPDALRCAGRPASRPGTARSAPSFRRFGRASSPAAAQ